MDWIKKLIDFILHIDVHLAELVASYGTQIYGILFLIIFAETGLIIFPLLPGDSLLFAAGALCATSAMDIWVLTFLLTVAAILGNILNFYVGRYFGPRIFKTESRWIKKEYLARTQVFYDKYGALAVVLSRFIPIVRSFVPFVAGVAQMNQAKYMLYTVLGAILWVYPISFVGYWFGNVPIVKENFGVIVLVILFLSAIPVLLPILKHFYNVLFSKSKDEEV